MEFAAMISVLLGLVDVEVLHSRMDFLNLDEIPYCSSATSGGRFDSLRKKKCSGTVLKLNTIKCRYFILRKFERRTFSLLVRDPEPFLGHPPPTCPRVETYPPWAIVDPQIQTTL